MQNLSSDSPSQHERDLPEPAARAFASPAKQPSLRRSTG
jgi:hypothetical protein